MVLGRLMRGSNFHLRKLGKGSRIWFENQLAAVFSRIEDSLPKTLDLSEQSLFALGYYQQIAHDRTAKSESNSEESLESNTPQEKQDNV
jgi:CRISPR-associated protein Csd1